MLVLDRDRVADYQKMAQALRQAGIRAELRDPRVGEVERALARRRVQGLGIGQENRSLRLTSHHRHAHMSIGILHPSAYWRGYRHLN